MIPLPAGETPKSACYNYAENFLERISCDKTFNNLTLGFIPATITRYIMFITLYVTVIFLTDFVLKKTLNKYYFGWRRVVLLVIILLTLIVITSSQFSFPYIPNLTPVVRIM